MKGEDCFMDVEEIICKSQQDWDNIPDDFTGYILIDSPENCRVIIEKQKSKDIIVTGNSIVEVAGNVEVRTLKNASVRAYRYAVITARDNVRVEARENARVEAWGRAVVIALDNTKVRGFGDALIKAWGNVTVVAEQDVDIIAMGNSNIKARGNARVKAGENANILAWDNVRIEASGNTQVIAYGNVTVSAWGEAAVTAHGNVQIIRYSPTAKLKIRGNARIATPPEIPEEYCDFYGITVKDGNAILYKAVQPNFCSFFDKSIVYKIGTTIESPCDESKRAVWSYGLYVCNLWEAVKLGKYSGKFKIIECAVPLNKMVVLYNNDGVVRTSKLTVLREVPKAEWEDLR